MPYAKTNSASPYTPKLDVSQNQTVIVRVCVPVPRKFMMTTTIIVTVIQTAGLIFGFQNPINTAEADNSAGRMIVQLYLFWIKAW